MDQAGVGKIHFAVAILSKQPLQGRGSLGKLKWNLKHTGPHVFQEHINSRQ